jgi:hypothetical protein
MVGGNDLASSKNQLQTRLLVVASVRLASWFQRPNNPLGKYKYCPIAQPRSVGRLVVEFYEDCILSVSLAGLVFVAWLSKIVYNSMHDLVVSLNLFFSALYTE